MVGIAETCCVVTAFESSEKHVGEQSDYSKVHKQFSCSGVILNESHGLVLCSGHLFSRFLIRKDVLSTDFQFLLRGSFSDTLTIYVQHDYTTHPSNAITCRVDSNQFWGSGVLLNSQLVLTCRHVLNGKSRVVVRYKTSKRLLSVMGDVLFATKVTAPFDVAIVWLQEPLPDIIVPKLASSFKPGKSVCIIGYGVFGHSCGHSVTSGILSKVVTCQSQAAMLQTTCAVQAGASGGALVQTDTGELLGLVCSNTRDFAADVTYPHLNFCIPMSVLAPLLQAFSVTHDPTIFQKLDDAGPEVARVWRLQIRPQRHQTSRL
nr:peroxisomal leader peptide-processing protease isoform X2 [Paramormyrops kingsleyae]